MITKTMPGVVEQFDGRMWCVRFGEGMNDIHWLRPTDFRMASPIMTGMKVELQFESLPHSGLWKATVKP